MSEAPERSGDRELSREIEATVGRFRRLIHAVAARHRLGDTDVDEVLQEVRLRLWRNRGDAETLRALGASYVYKVAMTAALDVLRARRARRTGRDVVAPLTAVVAPATDDPAQALERTESEDRIFKAVEQLSANRRPVVRMFLAGYDREEVARTLGWTVGKVRNLLSRGLADLRTKLTDADPGPEAR